MPVIDDNNRGPLVNIGIWISLVAACLAAATKVSTKWALGRRLHMDDVYILLALFSVVGTNIAISMEVAYGLGSHQAQVNQTLDSFLQAQYASEIIYILAIYLTKLTALHFFLTLAQNLLRRRIINALILTLFVWLFTATIVAAVQCQVPQTWLNEPGRCINQTAFWTFNAIIDCISQIVVASLPIFLLHDLQSVKSKKYFAMLIFSPNLLAIPLSILRVIYFTQSLSDPQDTTWSSFNFALTSGLHVNVGLVLACIPFAKPVIDSLVLEPQVVALSSTGEESTVQGTLSSIFRHKGWKRKSTMRPYKRLEPSGRRIMGSRSANESGKGSGGGRRTGNSTLVDNRLGGSVGGREGTMSDFLERGTRSETEIELDAGINWLRGPAVGLGNGFEGTQATVDTGRAAREGIEIVEGGVEEETRSQSDQEQATELGSNYLSPRRDGSQERIVIRQTTSVDVSSVPRGEPLETRL